MAAPPWNAETLYLVETDWIYAARGIQKGGWFSVDVVNRLRIEMSLRDPGTGGTCRL